MYCDRLMVKYDRKMFYRSTGRNSLLKDTWFPCTGIQKHRYKSKKGIHQKGWIKKPNGYEVLKYFREYKIEYDELDRFGTIKNMFISYTIGGGFWNTKESNIIKIELLKLKFDIDEDVKAINYAIDNEQFLVNMNIDQVLEVL
jgi:hypothetical protein